MSPLYKSALVALGMVVCVQAHAAEPKSLALPQFGLIDAMRELSSEEARRETDRRLALVSAEQAMLGIPVNSPDWYRAQDIAMVSRTAVERQRRRR